MLPRTIVLAKITNTGLRRTGKIVTRDKNYFPEIESCPEAKACIWLNQGTQEDLVKAREFAKKEGYEVFTFLMNEKYPLRKAKDKIMKMFEQNRIEITSF